MKDFWSRSIGSLRAGEPRIAFLSVRRCEPLINSQRRCLPSRIERSESPVITVRELARYLKVYQSTIYRLLRGHKLPSFRPVCTDDWMTVWDWRWRPLLLGPVTSRFDGSCQRRDEAGLTILNHACTIASRFSPADTLCRRWSAIASPLAPGTSVLDALETTHRRGVLCHRERSPCWCHCPCCP